MWMLQRRSNNIFVLRAVGRIVPSSSYSLLVINDAQKEHCLEIATWIAKEGLLIAEGSSSSEIYKYFMELAKEILVSCNRFNFSKKVISQVEGTSRLIRTSDKKRIYIGYRKGNKTLNETRINSVCIDDSTRNKFFNAVKKANYYKRYFNNKYELCESDEEFKYWSDKMDTLYLEQTGQLK